MKAIKLLQVHSIAFALLSTSPFFASLPPSSSKEEAMRTYDDALKTIKDNSETLKNLLQEFKELSINEAVGSLGVPQQSFNDLIMLAQDVNISSITDVMSAIEPYSLKQLTQLISSADYLELTPVLTAAEQSLTKRLISKKVLTEFNKYPAFSVEIEKALRLNTQRSIAQMIVGASGFDILVEKFKISANTVAFSPDGSYIAAGLNSGNIALLNASTGEIINQLMGHQSTVLALAFNPKNNQLASGSYEYLMLWDIMAQKKVIKTFEEIALTSIAFSPNGQLLAATDKNDIKIWDALTGDPIKVLTGHSKSVGAIAFNPTSTQLASGSESGGIILWDIKTGNPVSRVQAQQKPITGLVFSTDGTMLYSGSRDGTIKIFDLIKNAVRKTLDQGSPVYSLALRNLLAVALGNGEVKLWNPETGELVQTLVAHKLPHHIVAVSSIAFDPTGETLVSAAYDKTVKIWKSQASTLKKLSFKELLVFLTAKEVGPSKLNEKLKATYEGLPEEVKKLI